MSELTCAFFIVVVVLGASLSAGIPYARVFCPSKASYSLSSPSPPPPLMDDRSS